MEVVQWPSGVNKRAYNATDSALDNTVTLEFESGRKRTYQKNTRALKTFSFKIMTLNNNTANCEYARFWDWWENMLKSGANAFYFTNLLTKEGERAYRMTEPPSAEGQRHKEITITVEEI